MIQDPQQFQVAAGIDFDSIAPFVFVFLIVLSQIFGALKKKKTGEADEEPDIDALERARQIREEIRRKIEERRQEMEPGTTRPVGRPRVPEYNPTLPDGQPTIQLNRPVERKTSPAQPVYTPPVSRGPTMVEQLAEQRKKLETAKLKQQEARAQARKMLENTGIEMRSQEQFAWQGVKRSGSFRKKLMGDLRNRDGLRTAVVLREVLGKPLGLR